MAKNVAKKKLVFVGMSGGVDSSVSAALLKKAGFDVVGVFIKTWSPEWMPCSWPAERRDAMRVAAHLDIPLLTFDFSDEYKKHVADYMLSEYKIGRIPNPDVMCNKEIKFGSFLDKALKMGADFIATGHYAQVKDVGGVFTMRSSEDKEKDQTYFLWTLGQKELSKTIFPIGGMKKAEVRKLAKRFGLPVAEKKDSQGLCFIGKMDVKDFLKRELGLQDGDLLDEKEKIIGRHYGASIYTLGERHGFEMDNSLVRSEPYVVISKDVQKNTVTVSPESAKKEKLSVSLIELSKCSWVAGFPLGGEKYKCRIRYRGILSPCEVSAAHDIATVRLSKKESAVAHGQSLVIYDQKGESCLGGGIISKTA